MEATAARREVTGTLGEERARGCGVAWAVATVGASAAPRVVLPGGTREARRGVGWMEVGTTAVRVVEGETVELWAVWAVRAACTAGGSRVEAARAVRAAMAALVAWEAARAPEVSARAAVAMQAVA